MHTINKYRLHSFVSGVASGTGILLATAGIMSLAKKDIFTGTFLTAAGAGIGYAAKVAREQNLEATVDEIVSGIDFDSLNYDIGLVGQELAQTERCVNTIYNAVGSDTETASEDDEA